MTCESAEMMTSLVLRVAGAAPRVSGGGHHPGELVDGGRSIREGHFAHQGHLRR